MSNETFQQGMRNVNITHSHIERETEIGNDGGDDGCDHDEQKNKLIFIFYRYVRVIKWKSVLPFFSFSIR